MSGGMRCLHVQAEVAHKRSLAAYQVRSREEDEEIKVFTS